MDAIEATTRDTAKVLDVDDIEEDNEVVDRIPEEYDFFRYNYSCKNYLDDISWHGRRRNWALRPSNGGRIDVLRRTFPSRNVRAIGYHQLIAKKLRQLMTMLRM